MTITSGMDKLFIHQEIIRQQEWINIATCNNMDESHKHNVEYKKPKHILHYSLYVNFKNKHNESVVCYNHNSGYL